MDLSGHIDALRSQLNATAAAGTEQTRETARLLGEALEPAMRLALTDVLAAMAVEVSAAWDGGLVDIRVRNGDPEVVVVPPAEQEIADHDRTEDADGTIARISLRLPESLKVRAETAAAGDGVSLNAWLVRAVTAGLRPTPAAARPGRGPRRYTGFARS